MSPEFSIEAYNKRVNYVPVEYGSSSVKCHYCGSTNTKKITTTSKAVHTTLFGIWSIGRNSKNYHCNHCGSDF